MLRFALLSLLLVPQQPTALTPFAKVEHKAIDEMSGIVRSSRYPGIFWVHNDSGDVARIFAVDLNGKTIIPAWLQDQSKYDGVQIDVAANVDWEDITSDGERLFISDAGNNGNARRDLGIYVVTEPNPYETTRSRPLVWLPIAYPDQKEFPPKALKPFDCEAIFCLRGKPYFVTKHRDANGMPLDSASLYRLDTRHTDRVNVLRKLDFRAHLGGWVTGAYVSPDGKTLAVLTHFPISSVWLFDTKSSGDRFLSGGLARRLVFTGAEQCEAVAWESNDSLIVTNEQRGMFRLPLSSFVPVR